jgi:hypothetical protein
MKDLKKVEIYTRSAAAFPPSGPNPVQLALINLI